MGALKKFCCCRTCVGADVGPPGEWEKTHLWYGNRSWGPWRSPSLGHRGEGEAGKPLLGGAGWRPSRQSDAAQGAVCGYGSGGCLRFLCPLAATAQT